MIAAQSICRPLQAHAAPRRHTFQNLVALLGKWRSRARGRRELAGLSDRCLRDIGLSRFDALREIRKPFWRA